MEAEAIAAAGALDPGLIEPITVLLYGALTEASLVLGPGATDLTREQLLQAVERLVAGLLVPTDAPLTTSEPRG